ncbi:MAG: fibronectin type III domain-containing protein [Chitinophagales bacterium]
MRLLLFTLLALSVVFFQNLVAQENNVCGLYRTHEMLYQQSASYQQQTDLINENLAAKFAKTESSAKSENTLYTIPVVVHIIYAPGTPVGSGSNITDAQVTQGINYLNQIYNNTNNFYTPSGNATNIEFCLATTDPYGNSTSGITRTASAQYYEVDMATEEPYIKYNTVRWDTHQYMNIWLVNQICDSESNVCNIVGYSYLAAAHGADFDGLVIKAANFGANEEDTKAVAHEAGHYLNLEHTFRNGCFNSNCLLQGDFVCDTPPDNAYNFVACSNEQNTCSTDDDDLSNNNPFRPQSYGGLGDQKDMIENYMDYSYKVCQDRFTSGQVERMRASLVEYRSSLFDNSVCSGSFSNIVDVGISQINLQNDELCDDALQAKIILKNYGQVAVTYAQIRYKIDNGSWQTSTFNGSLAAGAQTLINLPTISDFGYGVHNLSVSSNNPNFVADANTSNDAHSISFNYTQYQNMPFSENFNNGINTNKWYIYNPDDSNTWQLAGFNTCNDNNPTGVFINLNNYSNLNTQDIFSLKLHLGSYDTISLQFDLAYAQKSSNNTDILQVRVKNTCDGTSAVLYNKSGTQLNTAGTYTTQSWSPSTCNHWRTENIDLSSFASQDVVLQFVATNGNGNNIYLDNIQVLGENTPAPVCEEATTLAAENITTNTALLQWECSDNAIQNFTIAYKALTASSWNYKIISGSFYQLTDLLPFTAYEFKVKTNCTNNISSNFSSSFSFATLAEVVEPPIDTTSVIVPIDTTEITTPIDTTSIVIPTDTSSTETPIDTIQTPIDTTVIDNTLLDDCPAPLHFTIDSVSHDMAIASWQSVANIVAYNLRLRQDNSSELWQNFYTQDTVFTFQNLDYLQNFAAELYSVCANDVSEVPDTAYFATPEPLCPIPDSLAVSFIGTDSIWLSWKVNNPSVQKFEIRYRKKESSNWIQYAVNGLSEIGISYLQPDTEYELEISSICNDETGIASDLVLFKTLPVITCDPPSDIVIDEVDFQQASLSWSGDENSSWRVRYLIVNGSKWRYVETQETFALLEDLQANTPYKLQIQQICGEDIESEYSAIIDFTTLSKNTFEPESVTETNNSTCAPPENIKTTWVDSEYLLLQWDEAENAQFYTIEYSVKNDNYWNFITSETNSTLLDNLKPNTTYTFHIAAYCENGLGEYSPFYESITLANCATPQNLQHQAHDLVSEIIRWDAVEGNLGYQVEYGALSDSITFVQTVSSPQVYLDHLSYCTNYWLRVRSLCNKPFVSFSDSLFFHTSACENPENSLCSPISLQQNIALASPDSSAQNTVFTADWLDKTVSSWQIIEAQNPHLRLQAQTDLAELYWWIALDWNNDGDIGEDELLFSEKLAADSTLFLPLAIPENFAGEAVRLKIMASQNAIDQHCNLLYNGISKEFAVHFLANEQAWRIQPEADFYCYPNPAQNTLHICWENIADTAVSSLLIFAADGRCVYRENISETPCQQIDIQHLPNGIYTLIWQNNALQHQQRFVIAH